MDGKITQSSKNDFIVISKEGKEFKLEFSDFKIREISKQQ